MTTLDELQLRYSTIGQGGNNSGKFADALYWSATSYDNNQARLLHFSNGNTSYHYNRTGTYREFKVRAVKDISR